MVGSPAWPFGPVSVKVTVKKTDSNKTLKVINTELQNDGAALGEYNWDIVWQSDVVEINLQGADEPEATLYTVALQ